MKKREWSYKVVETDPGEARPRGQVAWSVARWFLGIALAALISVLITVWLARLL